MKPEQYIVVAEKLVDALLQVQLLVDCVFRGKSAGDSDGSRPPIPIQVGHPFRLIPATP